MSKRCPLATRLVLLPLALLGILGFFLNTHVSLLSTNLDICFPKTNIAFLKTHKCAGSSIQNILMRYGDSHNLTFVLPKTGNYLGHPVPFSRTMVPASRLSSYNILAHHTRLDYNEIRSVMPRNSIYITILRNPIEVFESAYSYYGFKDILGANLHKFISKVPTVNEKVVHKRFKNKFGSNQMMFDLGADPAIFSNETLIKQYIYKLESWFDFVLISDRMDESLVLLRHLLCWDMDDVVTFKLNARDPKFKSSLNEREKNVLRKLNHADVLLYNHFVEKFNKAVDDFGRRRMSLETEQLRERTQKWYNLCIKGEQRHSRPTAKPKYYFNPQVMVFEATTNSNDTCKSMTAEELPYTDILRKKQQTKLKNFTSIFVRRRIPSNQATKS